MTIWQRIYLKQNKQTDEKNKKIERHENQGDKDSNIEGQGVERGAERGMGSLLKVLQKIKRIGTEK